MTWCEWVLMRWPMRGAVPQIPAGGPRVSAERNPRTFSEFPFDTRPVVVSIDLYRRGGIAVTETFGGAVAACGSIVLFGYLNGTSHMIDAKGDVHPSVRPPVRSMSSRISY
jgi:hypothetical protein